MPGAVIRIKVGTRGRFSVWHRSTVMAK